MTALRSMGQMSIASRAQGCPTSEFADMVADARFNVDAVPKR